MASLAELLELLYGARGRVRTARGVVCYRQSMSRMHEAHRREQARARRGRGSRSVTLMAFSSTAAEEGKSPPDLYEERQRFWWEPPDRLREETEASPPPRTHTTVHDGELWWVYSPESGAVSNVDLSDDERANHGTGGGGGRFKPLLDPCPLIPLLDFGEIEAVGARLRVRATPRADLDDRTQWHLHGILGADAVELEIERDTGIVRRMRATLDGEELWLSELEEIVVNEELPADTFVFVPPPGEEVLPPETTRRRPYTLEEAAAEAPFPVFFIPELPDGDWRLHVNYHAPRRRPPLHGHVWLLYSRPDARAAISLAQRPGGEGGFGWTGHGPPPVEEVERGGVVYTVARADPEQGRQNLVAFERDGTSLQLQSGEVDAEALLRLAASLEPVETAG